MTFHHLQNKLYDYYQSHLISWNAYVALWCDEHLANMHQPMIEELKKEQRARTKARKELRALSKAHSEKESFI